MTEKTAKPAAIEPANAKPADAPGVAEAKPVAAAPKKAAPVKAVAKPAPKKAAVDKPAPAAKKAKPRKAAKKKTAPKAAPATAATTPLPGQIGQDIAAFAQSRFDANIALAHDMAKAVHAGEVISLQQDWMDKTGQAYAAHLNAMHEHYQDMMAASFDPVLASFKDAGEQWRRMIGV